MRLRFGAAMALKGGRPCIVGVEVRERRDQHDIASYRFYVGRVERVEPFTVEAVRARLQDLCQRASEHGEKPCVMVDVGSPQGIALRQSSVPVMEALDLHRPHAYQGKGKRDDLFAAFLQAYTSGAIEFAPGLDHRHELDRALVFYVGSGVKTEGVELDSEDEAMVVALGLAITWAKHGEDARDWEDGETQTSGMDTVAAHR